MEATLVGSLLGEEMEEMDSLFHLISDDINLRFINFYKLLLINIKMTKLSHLLVFIEFYHCSSNRTVHPDWSFIF